MAQAICIPPTFGSTRRPQSKGHFTKIIIILLSTHWHDLDATILSEYKESNTPYRVLEFIIKNEMSGVREKQKLYSKGKAPKWKGEIFLGSSVKQP